MLPDEMDQAKSQGWNALLKSLMNKTNIEGDNLCTGDRIAVAVEGGSSKSSDRSEPAIDGNSDRSGDSEDLC
jgi:hypothetical protein